MKASEMTNDELAWALEGTLKIQSDATEEVVREVAARLRNVTVRTDNSGAIAELQRRLKVAEDALAKLQDRLVSSVHDGTIDSYEALKIAEDAIAVIREEGEEK